KKKMRNSQAGSSGRPWRFTASWGPDSWRAFFRGLCATNCRYLRIPFEYEKELLVPYKDIRIPGQRFDILVASRVLLELKTVEAFAPAPGATPFYLKATGQRLGFLINFKVLALKDGIKRLVRWFFVSFVLCG